uniref:TAFA chemokine like family member 5, like n=1 Tax=Amphilophus citrinellus TaxID=61819 RepID=A0A3Q0S2B2_AMPCI
MCISSCEAETRQSVFTPLSDRNPQSDELTPVHMTECWPWLRALYEAAPPTHTLHNSPLQLPQCLTLLAVGTCEIVMLNRDSSVPRRTIARQTARCACRRGQIAGTTRARPACVDARIVRSRQWCEMAPCMEGEVCSLLFNRSGWTCTRGSGRIKTVTVIY